MKPLTYGSLFSGTECMSAAAIGLPLVPRFFAEVEPYPCAILRSKFPHVPNLGDVTKIKYDPTRRTLSNGYDTVDLSDGLDILAGGSPCFVAGTLVLTPSGYRPIEELKVGDEVVGGKTGEIRRVEAVGSKIAPVGQIKVLGRPPITCTPNHPFSCVRMKRDNRRNSDTYSRQIPDGDYAYIHASEAVGLYAGRAKWHEKFRSMRAPRLGNCSYGDVMTLAGYYLGDGYIRHFTTTKKSVVLALVSPKKIAEFRKRFEGKIPFGIGKDGKVVICRSSFALWLIENFGEGATEKRVPYWVYHDLGRDDLLNGYLATDGCTIGRDRKFLTVSRKLALGIADLIGHASVSKHIVPPTCKIEGRTVHQHDTYTVQWPHDYVRTKYINGRFASIVRKYEDARTAARVFNITVSDEHAYVVEGLWVKNCQDFSVAGLRAGARSETLDDGGTTRSSLIYTYVRLVREIRPRWIIYENVPGMLTSNEGRDFAHFLVALAQCGYGDFAWRVLDAQYVRVDGMERAVPQRRRRVWLVGRLGANDGRSAEILLEPYGDPGDRPPRRKTREEIARSLAARAGLHGGVVDCAGRDGEGVKPQGFRTGSFAQFVPDEVSGTLDCRHMTCTAQGMPCLAVDAPSPASFDPYEPGGIKTVREDGAATTVVNGTCPGAHGAVVQRVTNSNGGDVAPTLSCTDLVKQTTGQADNGGGYVCATIENHKSEARVREAAVAGTLGASHNASAANDNPLVVAKPAAVCYDGYNQRAHEEVAITLRSAATGTDGNDADPKVCVPLAPVGMKDNAGAKARSCGEAVGAQEGVAYTLDTVAPHAVAYGMNPQASLMHPCTEGVAQTLAVSHEGGVVQPRRSTCLTPGDPITKRVYTADGPAPTLQAIAEGSGVSAQAFVLPMQSGSNGNDVAPTLTTELAHQQGNSALHGGGYVRSVQQEDGLPEVVVRRLTPTECERLMGLPQQQYLRISDMNNDEFVAWEIGKGNISVDTENGIVYSNRRAQGIPCEPHELKGTIINGYRHLKIVDGKVRRAVRHHRVVWIAAHGIPPEGMVVDHINNNKTDNRISNLQLLTPEDNSHKAHDDGLYLTGEDNPAAKISDCEVEEILLTYQLGYTLRQVARMFGISKSRVHQLVHQYGWTQVRFTKEQIADPELVAYFRRVHDDWQKMIAEDGKTPKPKTEAFVRDWLAKISDPATCPDAPRFKVCGNGWATNCPRWILLNLLRAENINPWYQEENQ